MKTLITVFLLLITAAGFCQQRTGFLVSSVSFGAIEGKALGDLTFSQNFSDARITVKVIPEANSIVEDFKYINAVFVLSDLELVSDNPGSYSYFKGIATDADGLPYKFTCKLSKQGKSTFELPELHLKLVGSEVSKFTDSIN